MIEKERQSRNEVGSYLYCLEYKGDNIIRTPEQIEKPFFVASSGTEIIRLEKRIELLNKYLRIHSLRRPPPKIRSYGHANQQLDCVNTEIECWYIRSPDVVAVQPRHEGDRLTYHININGKNKPKHFGFRAPGIWGDVAVEIDSFVYEIFNQRKE